MLQPCERVDIYISFIVGHKHQAVEAQMPQKIRYLSEFLVFIYLYLASNTFFFGEYAKKLRIFSLIEERCLVVQAHIIHVAPASVHWPSCPPAKYKACPRFNQADVLVQRREAC
jgi:hypothetical protein